MNFLLKKIKELEPKFEKGGRFEKLHSVFDGFSTFLYVPDKVTTRGSHIRDYMDMKRTMTVVIIALLPALLFGSYNIGLQHTRAFGIGEWTVLHMFWFGFLKVLPLIIVSYVVGLGIEFIAAQLRGHEINEGFLVTGMLIPLIMPVDVPLWMLAVAVAFSVIIGKEVFGGTGMNILNPALTARAFLFFSYPGWMTGDKVWIEGLVKGGALDGFSGSTPLALAKLDEFEKMPSADGDVRRHHTRVSGRDIGDCNTDRSIHPAHHRSGKLAHHAQHGPRSTGNGIAAQRHPEAMSTRRYLHTITLSWEALPLARSSWPPTR